MFSKILIANRGAERPSAASHTACVRSMQAIFPRVTMFNKILIANRGAERPSAASYITPACAACGDFSARNNVQ